MVCLGFLYSGRIPRIVSVHCVGHHPGPLKCRFNFPYHSHQFMVNEFYFYPVNSRRFSIVGCLQVFGNVAYFWWMCYRFVIRLFNILNFYWWKIFQLSFSLSDRKVWCANRNSDVLSVEHFEKIEHSLCSPARWYGGWRFDELSDLGMNMCPLCFLCSSRCTSLPLFLISLLLVPSVEPVLCFLFSCPSSFSSWCYGQWFSL